MKSYHRLLLIGLINYALTACGGSSGETASPLPGGTGNGVDNNLGPQNNDGDLHLFYTKTTINPIGEPSIYAYNPVTQVSTEVSPIDQAIQFGGITESGNNNSTPVDITHIIYSQDNKIFYVNSYNPTPLLMLEDTSISTICYFTVTDLFENTVTGEVIYYQSATNGNVCSFNPNNLILHNAIIQNNLTAQIQSNQIPFVTDSTPIHNGTDVIGYVYPMGSKLFFIEDSESSPIEIFDNTLEISNFYIQKSPTDSTYFVVINKKLFAVSSANLLSTGQLPDTPIYESFFDIPESSFGAYSDSELYLIGSKTFSSSSIREIIKVSLSTQSADSIHTFANSSSNYWRLSALGDVVIAYSYDEDSNLTEYAYIQSSGTLLGSLFINGEQLISANTRLNNKLHINHQNGNQFTAIALSPDPSDYDTYINSTWYPTNYTPDSSVILVNNEAGLSGTLSGAQLQLFTSATEGYSLNLGFLPSENYTPYFSYLALGNFMGITFTKATSGFTIDLDYFVVDLTTANSLHAVAASGETSDNGFVGL